jgi:predicted ferric reductase
MSALFFVFLFLHCNFRLTSWDYLITAAVLYSACLAASQLRTYYGHGWNHHAALEMLPSGVLKVTVPTCSTWAPGQHVFIRFLCSGLHSFSAHPFTICSLPVQGNTADMVFYITPRGGFTSRLAALARQNPGRKVRVLLDGPYGGLKDQTLARFDKAVIIAGGAGAGFTLPVIKDVLQRQFQSEERIKDGRAEGIRTTEIKVVLAVRNGVQQEWYTNAINGLLNDCGCALTNISVDIHVTGEDWVLCPSCMG